MPKGVYKRTEFHRKILSRSAKGKTPWNKNNKIGSMSKVSRTRISRTMKGVKKSENHRKNISRNIPRGSNHYRYEKERSRVGVNRGYDLLGHDWMLAVKKRDKWTCAIKNKACKGRLEAHHILSWSEYPELRYDINNGITLCHYHHPRKRIDEKKMIPVLKLMVFISENK